MQNERRNCLVDCPTEKNVRKFVKQFQKLKIPELIPDEPLKTAEKFLTYLVALKRYWLHITNALDQLIAANKSWLKNVSNAEDGKTTEEEPLST